MSHSKNKESDERIRMDTIYNNLIECIWNDDESKNDTTLLTSSKQPQRNESHFGYFDELCGGPLPPLSLPLDTLLPSPWIDDRERCVVLSARVFVRCVSVLCSDSHRSRCSSRSSSPPLGREEDGQKRALEITTQTLEIILRFERVLSHLVSVIECKGGGEVNGDDNGNDEATISQSSNENENGKDNDNDNENEDDSEIEMNTRTQDPFGMDRDQILESLVDAARRLVAHVEAVTALLVEEHKSRNNDQKKDNDHERRKQHIEQMLPLLLRCLEHCLKLVSATQVDSVGNWKHTLARMTVTATTFLTCSSSSSSQEHIQAVEYATATPWLVCPTDVYPQLSSHLTLKALLRTSVLEHEMDPSVEWWDDDCTKWITNSKNNINNKNDDNDNDNVMWLMNPRNIQQSHAATWAKSGILRRMARRLLVQVSAVVSLWFGHENEHENNQRRKTVGDDWNRFSITKLSSVDALIQRIVCALGSETIAQVCHSHLLSTTLSSSSPSSVTLRRGTRCYQEPPHLPDFKLHGSLSVLRHLPFPMSVGTLEKVLPLSFALLDQYASSRTHQRLLGSSLLLFCIDATTPTTLLPLAHNIERFTWRTWERSYKDDPWDVLGLCLVRTRFFDRMKDHDTYTSTSYNDESPRAVAYTPNPVKQEADINEYGQGSVTLAARRREFTADLFLTLRRKLVRRKKRGHVHVTDEDDNDVQFVETEEGILLPLLLGGLCPLLLQHGAVSFRHRSPQRQHQRRRDADLLEVAREGITALLETMESYTQWELRRQCPPDVRTFGAPLAVAVALQSLLMVTYPAAKRYGGQLMVGLVSALGWAEVYRRNSSSHTTLSPPSSLSDHSVVVAIPYIDWYVTLLSRSASVALVLCGPKANDCLKKLDAMDIVPSLKETIQRIITKGHNLGLRTSIHNGVVDA